MTVKFAVAGDARDMHPVVRDEVYRIGYEAIRNSCQHSSATRLEVELRYSQELTLRVSDNGIGIDQAIADKGKDGTSDCKECASEWLASAQNSRR